MSDKLDLLAQRRAALSGEIALHRVELALAAQRLRRPLHRVDELREHLHALRANYALLLIPAALLVLLNPRPALRRLLAALAFWRAFEHSGGPPPVRMLEAFAAMADRRGA